VAETVVINIEANTKGLQSTIDYLTKIGALEKGLADQYSKTTDAYVASIQQAGAGAVKEFEKASAAIKGIKTDNSLAKSLDVSKEIAAFGNGMKSLKTQLREATQEAQKLADKYGELDSRTLAAAKRAGQLKDQIQDINAQINALTPEGKFQAISNLGSAISGVFQVATGALQAFGVESETATKLAQQFQGALNISQGAAQLAQLSDAFSALKGVLGLTTAAKVADTAATEALVIAEGEQVVATEAATGAQAELNVAVLANPYVLAAAAVAALVAGLVIYANTASEAERQQKQLSESIYNANIQAQESISKEATDIKLLVEQYQNANTTQETRKQIVKELNRLAPESIGWFNKEGVAIVDLKAKTDAYVASLLNTAKARAIADKIAQIELENQKLRTQGIDKEISAWDIFQSTVETAGKITLATATFGASAISLGVKGTDAATLASQRVVAQYKDNLVQIVGLKNELTKLGGAINAIDKQTTTPPKTGGKTRAQLAEEQFQKEAKLIEDTYAGQRLEEQKNFKNKEEFATRSAEITQEELKLKIELYKKYNKDSTDLQQQLLDNFQKNLELQPVAKIPAIEKLKEEPLLTPEQLKALQAGLDEADRIRAENRAKEIETEKQKNEAIKKLKQEALDFAVNILEKQFEQSFQNQMDQIEELKNSQLDAIKEEEEALLNSYDNRRIGKRELEEQQKRLTLERVAAEKKAEKELNEIRRKQDISKRAMALFDIALNTYRAVTAILGDPTVLTPAKPGLIAAAIALGGIQAAGVLATPLPKYKKGTLSVPGVGSDDSQLALLQPGEAVIPTDTNRRYKSAISAIYHNKINPDELNRWVTMRLKGSMSDATDRSLTARLDTADLYSLSRLMKKNDGVYVKNIGELASVFESLNNPRR
jgi:hypothetical protein